MATIIKILTSPNLCLVMAGLIWSQSAAADYLFTFDITVNERRFEDSIYAGLPSYSMRYDQGQLDTSYIPQVISTQYRLTTDDLIAGELFNANTLRAYTTDIINLNSQLYTEALAIIPDGYGLGSNPKISNEMYVRETFPTQDPLPVDAWAAAAFQVYGSDVAYIEHDTSNPSRHTFEYAEWEMRTNLNSELLPLDFNHELRATPLKVCCRLWKTIKITVTWAFTLSLHDIRPRHYGRKL